MGTVRALCWETRDAPVAGDDVGPNPPAGSAAALPPIVSKVVTVGEAAAVWRERGARVWVDVTAPSGADVEVLVQEFGLHDAVAHRAQHPRVPNPRPRTVDYGTFMTVAFYVPRAADVPHRSVPSSGFAGSRLVPLSEIDLVFAERFLITVHADPVSLLERMMDDAQCDAGVMATPHPTRVPARTGSRPDGPPAGLGQLVHDVLDKAVDAYFPVLDELVEQVEHVQALAFVGGRPRHDAIRALFRLKKGLLALRRIMSPQADALRVLARRGVAFYQEPAPIEFQDVFDRAVRVEHTIQLNQDLLLNAREAYVTRVSNELGVATQALLVAMCMVLVPLFVTALYGMNFLFMPEHRWPLGRPWAIGLVVLIDGGLLYFFHSRRWI